MLQDLVDKTNLASFTALPLSLFRHKDATKVLKWSKGTLLLVQKKLLCFTSGDVHFLRKEENEKSCDGEHDIVLLMVGTTQNNGKWFLACWQMDKNYSRISTHLSSLSQLSGKIVLHLFWGLALDILHIYSWMHPKSLKTADSQPELRFHEILNLKEPLVDSLAF